MKIVISANTLYQILPIIATFANTIVTIILAVYIFRREPTKTYLQERYEKVIFPLYSTFEPFLYTKEVSEELIIAYNECKQIINENRHLVGGELQCLFSKKLTSYTSYCISREIDKEYDKSCKELGITKRTLEYRIGIYKNVPKLYIIKRTIKGYVPLVFFLLLLFFIIGLVKIIPIIEIQIV